MKIEFKAKRRTVKGSGTARAFDGAEDEEEEARRRRTMEKAMAEVASASEVTTECREGRNAGTKTQPIAAEEPMEDTEEAEMERLRGSVRFQTFSAKYGRDQKRDQRGDEEEAAGEEEDSRHSHSVKDEEGSRTGFAPLEGPLLVDEGRKPGEKKGSDDGDDEEEGGDHRGTGDGVETEQGNEEEADDSSSKLPISHEATLHAKHSATVSSIALDKAGNRFCTASLDYTLNLYDFGSMHSTLKSFRSVQPLDGSFPVRTVEFSPTGGKILVAGGATAARMLDRDARELLVCPHGDMYLHDMANTRGHVAPLSAARWHPTDATTFITAAGDGTIRLWDATATKLQKHKKIIKLRNRRGQKTSATAIAFSPDGRRIVAGCDDGGLRLYDPAAYTPRMVEEVPDAHGAGTEASCVVFSSDGHGLLTRSLDDCLRLWDVRRFDSPLVSFEDLPNRSPYTAAVFDDYSSTFVTGTSATFQKGSTQGGEPGKLVFFDRSTLRQIRTVRMQPEDGHVVAIQWHPDINQILYGTSTGSARVLYSPTQSAKGVLRCLSKVERRKEEAFVHVGPGKIYTPNALPMFRDEEIGSRGRPTSHKRQQERQREDPVLTKKPFKPSGPDAKAVAGSTLSSFVAQSQVKATWMEEDPREALLKLDEKVNKLQYFTGGYNQTDPSRILAEKTLEEEVAEEKERLRKRAPAHKVKQEEREP